MPVKVLAVPLMAVLVLSACSPSARSVVVNSTVTSTTRGGAELLDVMTAATPAGGLPLATLVGMVVPDQEAHDAIQHAIASCMNEKGFDYLPVPYLPIDLFGGRRYGITDEAQAARYGYDSPPSPSDAIEEELMARPPVDETALFGDGATASIDGGLGGVSTVRIGGCLQQGWGSVFGDYVAWNILFERIQEIVGEAYVAAETDAQVERALSKWVACMAEAGYAVTSLEDAPYGGGPAAAVADAHCNQTSGLASTWAAVEAEQQWSLLLAHADALSTLIDDTTIATAP